MSTADPFDTPVTEPDPFDTPAYDPATGELLEPEQAPAPAAQVSELDVLPVSLAAGALQAVGADNVTAFAGDLSAALEQRVAGAYDLLVRARPGGVVTAEVVAPEVRWLAGAVETMDAMGKVFTSQARGLRQLAGDVVLEVRHERADLERTGGSASVKVGASTGGGEAIKITATQPTETFTDTPKIVDVLVPYLLETTDELGEVAAGYAEGARAMAALLLGTGPHVGLLASPKWKSTALDQLRLVIQAMPVGAELSARLAEAYGRRPVGNLRTEVERVPARQTRDV